VYICIGLPFLKLIINLCHLLYFQIISAILAYSNSCVNPILYAFLSEPFRRGFCAVITCIRPSGPHGMNQNTELAAIRQRVLLKTAPDAQDIVTVIPMNVKVSQ